MSLKENACRKFQANIFNKSKCQNCFKPRESHLLNDEDLNQAKPIYGGWLLLAPEGTNFDNPLHRSRKWQRRFFILYEHGLLRYALDEMPSTLPQGTINMNQCLDVIDGESRTGQRSSLCILTPDKEHFIRAECKEIINGWQEALTVYPRTNKQNQKKKRKVDPPTHQDGVTQIQCFSTEDMNGHSEPGPAKVTVTSSSSGGGSIPCVQSSMAGAEQVPMSRATLWQEQSRWSRTTIPCSRSASCLSQLNQSQPDSSVSTRDDGSTLSTGRKVRVESGYFSLEKTKSEPSPQSAHPPQPPQHLPLSSSPSSSSLGAPSSRYNSESESQIPPHQPAQDPLPSPKALVSPSYSTISSSQSSLDSEPSSRASPTWEGRGSGAGGRRTQSISSSGSRAGRSGREYTALSDVPRARILSYKEAFRSEKKRQELRARTRSPGREEVVRLFGEERRRSQIIGRFEENQSVERMDTSGGHDASANQRQGRSERRYLDTKHEMSLDTGRDSLVPDVSSSNFLNLRRAKSLDRRASESSMTIDVSAITSMDDESLATYIPTYGDRIATRRFCSQHQRKGERDAQRQKLLQKLKRKMGINNDPEESDPEESNTTHKHPKAYLRNNQLAAKKTRKVELGWIHEGKQQRKKNGGGTRKVDLPKEAKKSDILKTAKELFFPNGKSKKGKLEDFTFDILDYQEEDILEEDMTVGEIYSLLKMGMLRFYLCTKERKESRTAEIINIPDEDEENHKPENEHSFSSDSSEVMIGPYSGEPLAWQLDDTLPILSGDEGGSVTFVLPSTSLNLLSPVNQSLSNNSEPAASTPTEDPESAAALPASFLSVLSSNEESSVVFGNPSSILYLENPNNQPLISNTVSSTSSITEQPTHTSVLPTPSVSSSYSEAHTEENTNLSGFDNVNINIKLHRTKLMDELIGQFKDPSLLSCPLKFTFINEIGADADGVSRDVYSAFWTEFLDCLAEGQEMRVPLLTPKWQEEEWKSVGRILVKGFQDHGYFPSRLAPAFTVALVFGEHSVSPDILFESLLLYISPEERDLVNKALLEDLTGEEHEELLDLLDRMGAKSIPSRENLKALLLNVAHKLIIQQPKYALDKMSDIARTTFAHAFKSQLDIQEMYANMKPTAKKVLKLLDGNPATQAESQSLRYLQQYVRGLDQGGLRKFLRFTTGSDVLCVKKIEVLFTSLDGVARRPIAHTCGPVLELPWTYMSFPELRVEFDNILSSNKCYVMDIA